MARYYGQCPPATPQQTNPADPTAEGCILSEYNKLRESLLTDDAVEGWASELCRYLWMMQREVTKETDLVKWWQVSYVPSRYHWCPLTDMFKDHAHEFHMLARIALDVLPTQASSVPCEQLFSGTNKLRPTAAHRWVLSLISLQRSRSVSEMQNTTQNQSKSFGF